MFFSKQKNKNKDEFDDDNNKHNMLKDDDKNNEDEGDEMKDNKSKWKRMKSKSKNNCQSQEKQVKKKRHESEVELIEDGGGYEDELKKSKETHEIVRKCYDRLSKESANIEKRHEELLEKLKNKNKKRLLVVFRTMRLRAWNQNK